MKINTKKNKQLKYDELKEGEIYLQKSKAYGDYYISQIETFVSISDFLEIDLLSYESCGFERARSPSEFSLYAFYKPTKRQLAHYKKCVEAGKFVNPEKKPKKLLKEKVKTALYLEVLAKNKELKVEIDRLEHELFDCRRLTNDEIIVSVEI